MNKAFVTFGLGQYAHYLDIVRPGFVAYAKHFGYDYIEVNSLDGIMPLTGVDLFDRPLSWGKVPVLLRTLASYDAALWVDCDAVIVDGAEDVAAHVPDDAWQAMVAHRVHQGFVMGEVPACGMWFLRPPMIAHLQEMWTMTRYIDHVWWEQAAMHELLGYEYNGAGIFPVRRTHETTLYRHTHFLPVEWDSIDYHDPGAEVKIMHVPGIVPHEERLHTLRRWAIRAGYHDSQASPEDIEAMLAGAGS